MEADPGGVKRRLAAWRRTGDLGRLWPDLSPGHRARAHGRILTATRAVLAPERRDAHRFPMGGDPSDLGAMGAAAFLTGMGPLLGRWIEDGSLDADDAAAALFAEHLAQGRLRAERLGKALARLDAAARAEGARPIVLKGLHTGRTHFPEPGTRPAADIDLLARPGERDALARALVACGYRERRRTRFARRSEWVPADAGEGVGVQSLELDHASDPYEVDLHVRLERWYHRGVRCDLGGGPFPTTEVPLAPHGAVLGLAHPWLALFLALHAGHDPTRLRLVRIVELVFVLRADRDAGLFDPAAFDGVVASTGAAPFVYPALALAEGLCPGTVDPWILARCGAGTPPRTRRVLAALEAAHLAPLPRPSLDQRLMWARGARDLLLGLSELAVPSDDGRDEGWLPTQARRIRALVAGRAGWRADAG